MDELCLLKVFSLTQVYFCLFSLGATNGLPTVNMPERKMCNTTECQERATFLLDILDNSTKPCDDFDQYICDKWIQKHPIPEDQSSYGVFSHLRADLERELKDILGNATLSFQKPEMTNITHKILRAYQSCTNESISVDKSMEALREIMSNVGIAKWPVSYTDTDIPEWKETFTKLVLKLGLTPVVNLYVSQDLGNVTNYALQMDQHVFGIVGRNQFLNQSNQHNGKIIEAYKQYIVNITTIMTNGTADQEAARTFADEIVDFEVQIANRTRSQEARRNYIARYNKVTVGGLQKNHSEFPLLEIVKNIFNNISISVDEEEPVIVWETDYYKSVLDFLGTVNRSTLHNYFGFQVLLNLGQRTSERFRNLEHELRNAVTGAAKPKERWVTCINDLQKYASFALGRIYVGKMFTPAAKEETETFVKELKKTFHALIEEKEWMDNGTKGEALKKVDSMTPKIGYADWLMDDCYLEEKYKYVEMFEPDTPYVKVITNLFKNLGLTKLGNLHTSYNKTTEWLTGPAVVNAFYHPGNNEITFPAGVLQPPFYKYGLPLSLNMGGIGVIIGHEVTHAFDDKGSQFNSKGELLNWWTNDTRTAYKDLKQCLIEQYGSIKESQTCLPLNSLNTQGEDVSDNGGLLGAYLTYKRVANNSEKYPDLALPGLENFTSDQMFFISNAAVLCNSMRTPAMRHRIQYIPHTPSKYRTQVPMSNMPAFSEAFTCENGTTMNPYKRCRVW
ncbi:neprilysin-4-like isoform X2 [Ornithodoros turicata]|uniref:neprilysin-4-like isoform X2 n=1 Tax=Ornithodoros turicata TaxID=34597 RepID=UPI00313A2CE6